MTVERKFDGDPRVFEVVDGKLYLNLNPDIQAMWRKDTRGNIRKAEKNWTALRSKAAHDQLAHDEVNVSASLTGATKPLAIHGYDPVAYFTVGLPTTGSAKFTATHGGAAYRFASEANKAAFEKNPARYLPQFGGFCAFGVTVGRKFDGDPRVFEIVDNRLYLNLNPDIQAKWRKDTQRQHREGGFKVARYPREARERALRPLAALTGRASSSSCTSKAKRAGQRNQLSWNNNPPLRCRES